MSEHQLRAAEEFDWTHSALTWDTNNLSPVGSEVGKQFTPHFLAQRGEKD